MAPQQQTADPDAKLKSLFTKLDTAVKGQTGSLKKTLKLIDSILALAPGDADALKCRVVVLIQYDEFQQALDAIAAISAVAADLLFEKAYCYYRLGKLEQALSAVQQLPDERLVPRLQLEAQLHYRLGDNKQAIKVYQELFQKHKVESLELRTNVIAAYVCGGHADKVSDTAAAMQISASDSSDVGFNMACALLQLGSFAEAEEQLQLALRAGREALLEEDVPDDEAAEELAPITAQLAYAHGELGRSDEALAAYQELEALERLDQPTAAIVHNNAVAAGLADGVVSKKAAADALKRLEGLFERAGGHLSTALEARLLDTQKQALLGNRVLLLLAAQKLDAAGTAFQALASRFPDYPRLALLHAALLAQSGKMAEAAATLEGPAAAALGLPAVLMRAQLALASGDRGAALALLTSLQDEATRHQPAVIATVASLQEQDGDRAGVLRTLRAALQWWRGNMADARARPEHPEHWLLSRLLKACITSGDVPEARRLYIELAASGAAPATQADALALLAAAHGLRHEAGIEDLASGLPPLPQLDSAAVSKLESSAASSGVRWRREDIPLADGTPAPAAAADAAGAAKKGKKKSRKRKPRYPAGFDPAAPGPPPDPERWLAKWQRSDFKKPRKSRRTKQQEGVKGSQGQGRVDESLDASKRAAPEAGPSQQAPPGKAAAKSAGGGRRKGRR